MIPQTRFRISHEDAVAEAIDGEVVIIDLARGYYYVLAGIAARIWTLIEARASGEEVVQHSSVEYEIDSAKAGAEINAFVEELLANHLIRIDESQDSATDMPNFESASDAYTAPTLKRFDDMAEMFALDPPLPALRTESE